MKIAVILSSNRSNGFSARLLQSINHFCRGRAQIVPIWLNRYRIDLCDADNRCSEVNCGLPDDMEELSRMLVDADALVYIPVVHAYGACSRMQAFIERLGYGFMRPQRRPLQNKLAIVATVGRRYSHESVFSQMILNLMLNRCIIVGSGFPPTFRSSYATPEMDAEAWDALKTSLLRMIAMHEHLNDGAQQFSMLPHNLEVVP